MDEIEILKRTAAVRRMAVTMAATDGLISAKILSQSEFQGNPISEEALDAKNPVGKQSDGGRYFIYVRQDGRGQIMIHWPNGIQKTIKFLIPDHMLKDQPIMGVPALEKPQQADSLEDGNIAPQKTPESGEEANELSKELLLILLGMALVSLLLALVKFPAPWPYQLSRWAICAGAGWCSYKTGGWRRGVLAVLAVLYNPFQPIAFGDLWPWINALSFMLLGGISLRNPYDSINKIRLSLKKTGLILEGAWQWATFAAGTIVAVGGFVWIVWQGAAIVWGQRHDFEVIERSVTFLRRQNSRTDWAKIKLPSGEVMEVENFNNKPKVTGWILAGKLTTETQAEKAGSIAALLFGLPIALWISVKAYKYCKKTWRTIVSFINKKYLNHK